MSGGGGIGTSTSVCTLKASGEWLHVEQAIGHWAQRREAEAEPNFSEIPVFRILCNGDEDADANNGNKG